MSAFDGLQKASFSDIVFPVSKISIKGGLRDHVHEYPHSPGGDPEKLGRKLYTITIDAPMHETIALYPHAFSARLNSLQIAFEEGNTADLILPNVGTIQAYATDWDRDFDARKRSGEDCRFTFREDDTLGLIASVVTVGVSTVASAGSAFAIAAASFPGTSLFDQITAFVGSIAAIGDQVELYSNTLEAKTRGLASLCQEADHTLAILNQPVNHEMLDACHDLWASANKLNADVLKQAKPKTIYVVPVEMSISQVATNLYGDTSRAMEILQMNPIPDAFAIARNTPLNVYAF